MFYFLGSHGFTHHLLFFVFFFPIAIGQINVRNIRNLIYLSIFIATASLFTTSFQSSSYNLRNIDNLYENYPLKNLALELDSYFEEKAITQFDRERKDIKDWLLMEFAKQFDGEKGRMKISQMIDDDLTKAMDILDDPFTYREVFIHY